MKAPNIYQSRRHGNHLKKMALDLAMARVAMAELVELGLVVTGFRLGTCASITVASPYADVTHRNADAIKRNADAINRVSTPLQFIPMGFGFNGAFRYTTFAAAFGDWTVEWHKRLYPSRPRRDAIYRGCTTGTELRVRHHG